MLNNMEQLPVFEDSLAHQIIGLLAMRLKSLDPLSLLKLMLKAGGAQALLSKWEEYENLTPLAPVLGNKALVETAAARIDAWSRQGISLLAISESMYPGRLRCIYNPPPILFVRGGRSRLRDETPLLAIVGSRRADLCGCEIAAQFGKTLASAGACIVSGLALGIDAAAHRGALESLSSFPTIAVLGNGLASVYPASNERLAFKILDRGGLLVSQFEPDEKPYPVNFLNRNRIIAGLCLGTLIVQATKNSGSLVTARYSLEEGREVMVVPGAITDPRYEGSNNLLKQGAAAVTGIQDVYEIFPQLKKIETAGSADGSPTAERTPLQAAIIRMLRAESPLPYDALVRKLGPADSLASDLLDLELGGIVERLPGNRVALTLGISKPA